MAGIKAFVVCSAAIIPFGALGQGTYHSITVSGPKIAIASGYGPIGLFDDGQPGSHKTIDAWDTEYVEWVAKGSRLACCSQEFLGFMNPTGKPVGAKLDLGTARHGQVESFGANQSGRIFAIGFMDGLVKLWYPASRRIQTIQMGSDAWSLAFSSDERMLACVGARSVKVFRTGALAPMASYTFPREPLQYCYAAKFLRDGRLVVLMSDGTVRIAQPAKHSPPYVAFQLVHQCIKCAILSPENSVAVLTAPGHGQIQRYDLAVCNLLTRKKKDFRLTGAAQDICASAHGDSVYVLYGDGSVEKIEVESGRRKIIH